MKSKKLKIVLSVFIAVIVIATVMVGVYYGNYISKANAMSEKFGIDDCTEVIFSTVRKEEKRSVKQKMKIYDIMLNYFEKYEPTQEEIDNKTLYLGGFNLKIGDTYFSYFDKIELDGKKHIIVHMSNGSSNDAYYIMESATWSAYHQAADPDEWDVYLRYINNSSDVGSE